MSRPTSVSAAVLLMALAGGLTGCGAPAASSKEAFARALGPVVRDAFCHPIDVMRYEVDGEAGDAPFPVVTSPKRELAGPGSDGKSVAMLDAATSIGLVTRRQIEKAARWKGSDRPFVRQGLIAYAPTEKGEPFFREIDRQATRGIVPVFSFCLARGEIVDVVRWTEPVDLGGRRMSQVTYTYRGVDPIPAMPKPEQASMAAPKEATMTFELQADGWRPLSR